MFTNRETIPIGNNIRRMWVFFCHESGVFDTPFPHGIPYHERHGETIPAPPRRPVPRAGLRHLPAHRRLRGDRARPGRSHPATRQAPPNSALLTPASTSRVPKRRHFATAADNSEHYSFGEPPAIPPAFSNRGIPPFLGNFLRHQQTLYVRTATPGAASPPVALEVPCARAPFPGFAMGSRFWPYLSPCNPWLILHLGQAFASRLT